jgi:hypothetical protein
MQVQNISTQIYTTTNRSTLNYVFTKQIYTKNYVLTKQIYTGTLSASTLRKLLSLRVLPLTTKKPAELRTFTTSSLTPFSSPPLFSFFSNYYDILAEFRCYVGRGNPSAAGHGARGPAAAARHGANT